jgi:hypothetical protein
MEKIPEYSVESSQFTVNERQTAVGFAVGEENEGLAVGVSEGFDEGSVVEGACVGSLDGMSVGGTDGLLVGMSVG